MLDIDTVQKTASVNIILFVNNYPDNITQFDIWIGGGGSAEFTCYNKVENKNGWFFQGQSNQTTWYLEGSGETYPFDSYGLRFKIMNAFVPYNFSLTQDDAQAYFDGPNGRVLADIWNASNGLIPAKWEAASIFTNETTLEMQLQFQRTTDAFNIAFLEFIAPIIACYFLLGATLLLDPKKHLNERVAIYIALFVFVPTFLIAVQGYLPYRSALSFPELLLTNLVIDTTIFAVFSIIGKEKRWTFSPNKRFTGFKIHHNNWDLIGIILCTGIFALIYTSTLFGEIAPEASFIVSYMVIPSFVIWYPFENIKGASVRGNAEKISLFFILTLISTALLMIGLVFGIYITVIGTTLVGALFGVYTRNLTKGFLFGLLIGIVTSLLTGVIYGAVCGPIFLGLSGLDAILKGIVTIGVLGYPIGLEAALGGFIGAFLTQLVYEDRLTKKASNSPPVDVL